MTDNLDQLKAIVLGWGDQDGLKEISGYEKRLRDLAERDKVLELPGVKEWYDYLNTHISIINISLQNDRRLTETERSAMFQVRDICEKFTSMMDGKEREGIENTIKQLLDDAMAKDAS